MSSAPGTPPRPLQSTKEITKAEAGTLIDQLEAIDPATGEQGATHGEEWKAHHERKASSA